MLLVASLPTPLILLVRFLGWRTEFRTMEVQLTDFENAAFVVFIVLVTRVILAFDLGLYIPLSKITCYNIGGLLYADDIFDYDDSMWYSAL